jgi:hypothetical protein
MNFCLELLIKQRTLYIERDPDGPRGQMRELMDQELTRA